MNTHENKTQVSLYSYNDYRSFLNSYFEKRKERNSGFSTRVWSRKLGLKSPSTLNMILRGHRHPGEGLLNSFLNYFDFDEKEKSYFENLVRLDKNKKNESRRVDLINRLRAIHPQNNFREIEFQKFKVISKWYFLAIRELFCLKKPPENATQVSQYLGSKVSEKQASDALKTLEELKLLKTAQDGKWEATDLNVSTPNDIANEAIKQYHESVIDLAKESIRSVSVDKRHVSSVVFNVENRDLDQIKQEVFDFQKMILEKYQSSAGDDTFQFNMQLFPLTNMESKK